ncbi:uncharacterized protein LOC144349770 [Saccoglossus kowalevskii]
MMGEVGPYRFEPYAKGGNSDDGSTASEAGSSDNESDDVQHRIENTHWCTCSNCVVMPTAIECVCCRGLSQVTLKMEECQHEVSCIDRRCFWCKEVRIRPEMRHFV